MGIMLSREYQMMIDTYIRDLSVIGNTEHGLWRRPYTQDYDKAVKLVKGWMDVHGFFTYTDEVGNLIGRIEGKDPKLKVIATGSHLDSVKGGGNYDGALGIVSAIIAVAALVKDYGQPLHSIEVMAITGEEGSRFAGLVGSKWMAGEFGNAELNSMDEQGITLQRAACECGYLVNATKNRARDDIEAFLELHIEQGPVLDSKKIPIGVVKSIVGLKQAMINVIGRADHAGTTPMNMRRDAMLAVSNMILNMDETVKTSGGDTVFTVGQVNVLPGAPNIVAEKVSFTIDLRDGSSQKLLSLICMLKGICESMASKYKVTAEWKDILSVEPVLCDQSIQQLFSKVCSDLGVEHIEMVSGAGHDAIMMSRIAKTGMLFVPSVNGRSHCSQEYTKPEDCIIGTTVLSEAIHRLAY
jgi:allantoate deiminase